jgi:hypothetical protein
MNAEEHARVWKSAAMELEKILNAAVESKAKAEIRLVTGTATSLAWAVASSYIREAKRVEEFSNEASKIWAAIIGKTQTPSDCAPQSAPQSDG